MKKEQVVRVYSFSDATLVQKCDDVKAAVTRDQTEFTGRGISAADNTAFGVQRDNFDAMPTDEELEGDVTAATEAKDEAAENVRVSIRMFRTAAENKFTTAKANYRKFAFDGMDEMDDANLARLGKRISRVATSLLSELASEGITSGKITTHDATVQTFDDAIDAKAKAVEDRDIATEDRAEAGNALYKVLSRFCNTGKNIWETTNEAKHNDYVIYDTPSGKAEPPAPGTP